jgi:hypothetical protein
MFPAVLREVNQLYSLLHQAQKSAFDGGGLTGKGDHRAMMIDIWVYVEQEHSGRATHSFTESFDVGAISPFADIRHTLNERFHPAPSSVPSVIATVKRASATGIPATLAQARAR